MNPVKYSSPGVRVQQWLNSFDVGFDVLDVIRHSYVKVLHSRFKRTNGWQRSNKYLQFALNFFFPQLQCMSVGSHGNRFESSCSCVISINTQQLSDYLIYLIVVLRLFVYQFPRCHQWKAKLGPCSTVQQDPDSPHSHWSLIFLFFVCTLGNNINQCWSHFD